MRTEVRELRQLLRLDLVAGRGQIDRHDLLHLGGRMREDDDPVGQVDGLVDVVRDEEDRDPESSRTWSTRSSRSPRVCASTDANGSSMSRIDGW